MHCRLSVGTQTFDVFTRNVSEAGAYVIVRTPTDAELTVGQVVRLRCDLPDHGRPLELGGEIAWVDASDQDIDNAPAVGFGIQLHDADADTASRLRRFVDEFRYVVLVVGGTAEDRARFHDALSREYAVALALDPPDAFATLSQREVAVILVLPGVVGSTALALLEGVSARFARLTTARVVLSRAPDVDELRRLVNFGGLFRSLAEDMDDAMIQAIVREAVDRHALDAENDRIALELEQAKRALEKENAFLRQRLTGVDGFDRIIGTSPQLRAALAQLARVRRTHAPVFIHGETGTGKELVARALHAGGPRADHAYVVQNCAGMTETLLQSTLFGHRKGAFTGADRDYPGVFLAADGGTLFLDEVGELSPTTQAMLLRALQEGELTPIGATRPVKVDVRILSATHKDLREEVKAGRFREDLYFRLVVVTVRIPPLRERQGDVMLLARHFLDLHCERYGKDNPGFRSDTMAALEAYPWPGNVRELDNEIERMVILADPGQKLGLETLSPHIVAATARRSRHSPTSDALAEFTELPYDEAVRRLERQLVADALAVAHGSVTKAAERLGLERSRLGKIRKRLGL